MSEYIERGAVCDDCDNQRICVDKNRCPVGRASAADVVEVKHGSWVGEGDGYADGEIVLDVWYCSECNHCIDDGTDDPELLPNYCPNCGTKMDGERQ